MEWSCAGHGYASALVPARAARRLGVARLGVRMVGEVS
jgi:hypothetical protein